MKTSSKNLQIGQIGNCLPLRSIKKIAFQSKESLFDFDVIFLDLNSLGLIYTQSSYNEYSEKVNVGGMIFYNDFDRRRHDIAQFLKLNKLLIVSMPAPQIFTSGQHVDIKNLSLIPVNFETRHSEGKQIDIDPKSKLKDFFTKYKSLLSYRAVMTTEFGMPIAYVKGTTSPIATYSEKILFFPRVALKDEPEVEEYVNDLIEAIFHSEDRVVENPEWCKKYFLPEEKKTSKSLHQLNLQKAELEKKIITEEKTLEKFNKYKTIFAGTGGLLEKEIESLFSELGFEILGKDANRDDLIMKYGESIIVGEIKGVNGSAAEKQAAQLEKWVTEYHLENGKKAKGILIVNSFKDEELTNRKEQTFPHQMLDYSVKREHCLITGLQLLGFYYECMKNPQAKDELIKSLITTNGVYKGFENWNEFIEHKPAETIIASESI